MPRNVPKPSLLLAAAAAPEVHFALPLFILVHHKNNAAPIRLRSAGAEEVGWLESDYVRTAGQKQTIEVHVTPSANGVTVVRKLPNAALLIDVTDGVADPPGRATIDLPIGRKGTGGRVVGCTVNSNTPFRAWAPTVGPH